MSSPINDLLKNITQIPNKTEYWFVRTDDGQYFDTYTEEGFIAIGWNNISLFELRNSKKNDDVIRKKLIESEGLDVDNSNTKAKLTGIINKLHNFDKLKKGDVIIVPSKGSERLAFGIIKDGITNVSETEDKCKYRKRKLVEWKEVKYIEELDNIFYKIKSNRHSISNIDGYSQYIDKVINTLFLKDDNVHYVIDLKTQDDINVISLVNLIDGIQDLINAINIDFNLNERVEENAIKLNLQSPGQIEFKLPSGRTLVLLAMILSTGCTGASSQVNTSSNSVVVPSEISSFKQKYKATIDTVHVSMDDLEADKNKINSY